MPSPTPLFLTNAHLNQVECAMGRAHLESMPRYMTIVLGNGCNIDCPHCYQEKNGDNLLRNKEIGAVLRREFLSIYPYLDTLRIQGGEAFALKGFRDLVDDIASCVDRPLISISTNGTLIDAKWCQRIVSIPFQTVTISFDAGTPETFERLRRGAKFDTVVNNVKLLQDAKRIRNSWYPTLDAFYVVMRSNFREIPAFLDLMLTLNIYEVSFQTMLIDERNLKREPQLIEEQLSSLSDIQALHTLLKSVVSKYGEQFDRISWNGFKSLFGHAGLDSDFLDEESASLYPTKDEVRKNRDGFKRPADLIYDVPALPKEVMNRPQSEKQCPNPWTTLFVIENGDVSICFLSEPVGNLYETPLVEIWNGPKAIAKRSRMLVGRYTESGCSRFWCDWRDGKVANPPDTDSWRELRGLFESLTSQLTLDVKPVEPNIDRNLGAVRRLLTNKNKRISELEANLSLLQNDNAVLHKKGQAHIDDLEKKVAHMDDLEKTIAYLHEGYLGKERIRRIVERIVNSYSRRFSS